MTRAAGLTFASALLVLAALLPPGAPQAPPAPHERSRAHWDSLGPEARERALLRAEEAGLFGAFAHAGGLVDGRFLTFEHDARGGHVEDLTVHVGGRPHLFFDHVRASAFARDAPPFVAGADFYAPGTTFTLEAHNTANAPMLWRAHEPVTLVFDLGPRTTLDDEAEPSETPATRPPLPVFGAPTTSSTSLSAPTSTPVGSASATSAPPGSTTSSTATWSSPSFSTTPTRSPSPSSTTTTSTSSTPTSLSPTTSTTTTTTSSTSSTPTTSPTTTSTSPTATTTSPSDPSPTSSPTTSLTTSTSASPTNESTTPTTDGETATQDRAAPFDVGEWTGAALSALPRPSSRDQGPAAPSLKTPEEPDAEPEAEAAMLLSRSLRLMTGGVHGHLLVAGGGALEAGPGRVTARLGAGDILWFQLHPEGPSGPFAHDSHASLTEDRFGAWAALTRVDDLLAWSTVELGLAFSATWEEGRLHLELHPRAGAHEGHLVFLSLDPALFGPEAENVSVRWDEQALPRVEHPSELLDVTTALAAVQVRETSHQVALYLPETSSPHHVTLEVQDVTGPSAGNAEGSGGISAGLLLVGAGMLSVALFVFSRR